MNCHLVKKWERVEREERARARQEGRCRNQDRKANQKGQGESTRWNSSQIWTKKPEALHQQQQLFDRIATSFYFSDFPEEWQLFDMWRCFDKYGLVVDVFIPSKRAKNGKRFGFVRVKGVEDVHGLWLRLKTLTIGDYRLFIKPALFTNQPEPTSNGVLVRWVTEKLTGPLPG